MQLMIQHITIIYTGKNYCSDHNLKRGVSRLESLGPSKQNQAKSWKIATLSRNQVLKILWMTGVKWELRLAGFALKKWSSSHTGTGHWEWEKNVKNQKWEWDLRIVKWGIWKKKWTEKWDRVPPPCPLQDLLDTVGKTAWMSRNILFVF